MILGISGSPHKEGNTVFALKHSLAAAEAEGFETKLLSLAGKKISPCLGCFHCADAGSCVYNDDMKPILDDLTAAEGIILATPVYFGMVSGLLKNMMDRTVCLRTTYGGALPLAGKLGTAIACANSRNGGQETALQNIQTYLLQMNLRVVSDGSPYSHSGGTIAGKASEDTWGLETAAAAARNLCGMLKKES